MQNLVKKAGRLANTAWGHTRLYVTQVSRIMWWPQHWNLRQQKSVTVIRATKLAVDQTAVILCDWSWLATCVVSQKVPYSPALRQATPHTQWRSNRMYKACSARGPTDEPCVGRREAFRNPCTRAAPTLLRHCTYLHITLHYTKFKVKNVEILHTLYKHYKNLETMETTPRINEILLWFWRFAGNLMTSVTSLQLANCSMFVQRRQGTLGRQYSYVLQQWLHIIIMCTFVEWGLVNLELRPFPDNSQV